MIKIWHRWEKWECYKAGFYSTTPPDGISKEEALQAYAVFLGDVERFERAIWRVFFEWPHSCEHFLTNVNINRIAWLGQAAMCIETGISSTHRGGFKLLSPENQMKANQVAAKMLKWWENEQNRKLHQ